MAGDGRNEWENGDNPNAEPTLPSQTYQQITYLRNDSYWWSLSPSTSAFCGADACIWSGGNGIGSTDANNSGSGVRPVISLKPGQNFGYGDGTGENPYRFVETIS